jgi:hypothetical protein
MTKTLPPLFITRILVSMLATILLLMLPGVRYSIVFSTRVMIASWSLVSEAMHILVQAVMWWF